MSISPEDRLNLGITLEEVKEHLQKIKLRYLYIYKNYLAYFIVPNAIYGKIVDTIKNFNIEYNSGNKSNMEKCSEYLSKEIYYFSEKIKKDNDIFNGIIKHNNNLLNCLEDLGKIMEGKSKIEDITPPIDLWNNSNEKNYSNSCLKEMNISQKSFGSDNYRISLKCNNCSSKPFYFCNKHCYKYFCDCCKTKFDSDVYSHNFEQIDEEKEKEKIEFVNSSIYLIKNYCQITDKIFKLTEKNIKYPSLNKNNDLFSQKEFLTEIYNLNNSNNLNQNKEELCDLIKNSLSGALKINKSSYEIIDENFSFSEEISYSNDKIGKNELLNKTPKSNIALTEKDITLLNGIESICEQKKSLAKYVGDYKCEKILISILSNEELTENQLYEYKFENKVVYSLNDELLSNFKNMIQEYILKHNKIYINVISNDLGINEERKENNIIYKTLYKKVININSYFFQNDNIINFVLLELAKFWQEIYSNNFYFSKENMNGSNIRFPIVNHQNMFNRGKSRLLQQLFLNFTKVINISYIIMTDRNEINIKKDFNEKTDNNNSKYSSKINRINLKRYKKREKYKYFFNNKKYLLRRHGKNYFAKNKKFNPNYKNQK